MKKTTDITIILDRSGSMDTIKNATIEGFNSFIKKQKKGDFHTNLTFVQFDDEYEKVYEQKDIKTVEYLNSKTYNPRGTTALLDAIGITINSTKKRIKNLDKSKKPRNVVITIITDGYENASVEYSTKAIFNMIHKREKNDNWNFLFLAANQDAISEGAKFGIHQDRALTFVNNDKGIKNSMRSMSEMCYSLSNDSISEIKFSEADRHIQQQRSSQN